ncbi:MAG: hypothetical protein O3C40_37035 [Planctomycetota bacterium]|nr:hypothetical protein [Planctomycetota bacterium]
MPKRSFNARQRGQHRQSLVRRFGSRKLFVIGFGVAFGALVWFAPAIVANSPLKHRIIASAIGDFQGKISVGSISAGWLSKLSVKDVVVFDVQGERLVEAASIQLNKNLIALLRDRSNLGTIRVQQPIVNLVLRPDGSNIEDAIAPWLVPSDEPSNLGCEVEIDEGVLQVTDATTGSQWTATKLNVGVSLPNNPAAPLTLHVDSHLNPPSGTTGKIVADMLWQREDASVGKGKLSVQATAVPIELASPGLQRVLPGTAASGLLDGDVSLDWDDTSIVARLGQLTAQNLRVSAPEWFGSDRVELENLTASGEITQRGGAWQVQQLTLDSDIGHVTANGTASVTPSDEKSLAETFIEALPFGRFRVDGQIDLARIARMLPTTLKLREGMHVATGEVTLALGSETDATGQRWDGRVEARNLSGMYEGRHLTWDQPVVLTATARDLNGVITVDAACESSFLTLAASGNSERGSATLHGDFARLAAEVSQFVDLGELRVAGRLDGKVDWQTANDRRLRLAASVTAEQFELVSATRPAWREDRLTVQLTGVGTIADKTARAVDEGELRVQSGQDQLHLTLLPTLAGTVRETALPVELRLTGELRNWVARLQPVFVLPGWDVDGTIDLNANANVATNQVQIGGAHAQLVNFRTSNGSVFINEQEVQFDTQGTFNRTTGAFTSPDTTFASSSISLRATNIDVRMGATGTQFAGDVDYRGEVGKLANLFTDPKQPATRQIYGKATGHARLRHDGQVTSCEWSADVSDFVYAVPSTNSGGQVTTASQASSSWNALWQEPKLKLVATAVYDGANSRVDISRVEAAGETISFAARGTLSDLATRCTTELDGQVAYDLQKLASRFRQQLGAGFQIAGRDTRPFSFRGPLFSTGTRPTSDGMHPVSTAAAAGNVASFESAFVQMIAQASLGWSSASVQGVAIGAGEIDAKLSNGRLVFAPMDLSVSEGNVHLAPTVLLDRSPMVVTLPAGPVAERVRISPQMCGSWLKYLAPLVADATAAQGNFSVSLDQAVIPLDVPTAGQIEGVLEIHTAQIGPGPLSQQLLLLAAQIKAIADGNLLAAPTAPTERWLDLPPQRVAFQMSENRVYHQGLQMAVKDVVIRTSGSVGTDQTISLIAEVPIRDEWLSRSQYLAALRGQTIQVPIRGTLTSPKLDQSALTQITQQTVTGAANRYIQGGAEKLDNELNKQLNRGLEKLFAPR